ncbi:MAG: nuclear transport factor 2 family protein [Nitrospira sp.]|jgi:uncharacterized protein (TIGR02246 family)
MSQQAQSTNQADVEAINKVREVHIAAVNDGDVDAWVATFTDDGVQMPPNAPANLGSERIRAWSQAFLAPFRVQFTLFVDEVQAAGHWAFERGAYKINLTPKVGGEAIQDIGKYITVYERQPAGAWKIARDIWNSNNPPFTGR